MKHSVLDTLVYLFDYLVYEKKSRPTVEEMNSELHAAGFAQKDIDRSMAWLLELNDMQNDDTVKAPSKSAVRVFTEKEKAKLPAATRGFIHKMTTMEIIDTRLREIIIQKLLTLDEPSIHIDEVKWVTLMALFNRPGQEANTVWLEQSLLADNQSHKRIN